MIQYIGNAGGGDTCGVDGEAAGKVVVVELHAGSTLFISYNIGIPVEGAARIDSTFYRAVGILR